MSSSRVACALAVVSLVVACSPEARCPAGRTPAENGTCVDPRVVDFVACIDHANGTDRSHGGSTKLSADVHAATLGVATQTELQSVVINKVYPGSDAQGQRIIESCNAYVFGGAGGAGQAGGPPGVAPNAAPGASPNVAPSAPPGAVPNGAPLAGGACGLVPPPPSAWSLREREQWSALLRQTQAYLDETNRRCGTQICAAIAYETFRGHFAAPNVAGLDAEGVDHVTAPIAVLHQLCEEGAAETSAVRAKVQRVAIAWGGAGQRSTWALEQGVLAATIVPPAESSFDYRAAMRGPTGLRQRL